MKYVCRPDSKVLDDIKSAGQTFLAFRMEDLITRIEELEDNARKNKLINEFYLDQIGTHDSHEGGTRTRVNSAIRIIAADKIVFALERIDGNNPKVSYEAVKKAKGIVSKIQNGEIKLPLLDGIERRI